MGDADADSDNRVLKEEQDAQVLSFIYTVSTVYMVFSLEICGSHPICCGSKNWSHFMHW